MSSAEKPSHAKSIKNEKSIETGNSETERTIATYGETVEGTAVSPSTENTEAKPKDAVLEKGLEVDAETEEQTTINFADTIGEATISEDKKEEVTSMEEASVANVASEEMTEPPDNEISADTVASTARQGLEQPSASIVEDHPAEAKEREEEPMEETTPVASTSPGAYGAIESEDEDGESVVTRPIETDVAAKDFAAAEVKTDIEHDDELPIVTAEDDTMSVTDEEDDAVAAGPIEIQEDEVESTLTGPIETQGMADAPVISVEKEVEKEVDDRRSESTAEQPDRVESSAMAAVISSATGLIENDENPRSTVVKAPEAEEELTEFSNRVFLEEELDSRVADPFDGIIDVPIDEDDTGAREGGMDGETETITERSECNGRATDELRSRVVAEASQDWCVPVVAEADPLEGIIDVPIDEDDDLGAREGGVYGEPETDEPAKEMTTASRKAIATMNCDDQAVVEAAEAIDETSNGQQSNLCKSGEMPDEPVEEEGEVNLALETPKDVVVGTDTNEAIKEKIEITRVAETLSEGSASETTPQSKSPAASFNVVECIDDGVVVVAASAPIADEDSDSDSDYEEEESGFNMAAYDFEEDESVLELDSSAESDSEDEGESYDDKSISAAEDDDDDPIFELKNVTAMTRVLIPEDQRHNNYIPRPSRWAWPSGLGRTNTSNSNLSFGGHHEESVDKLEPKSELTGSPVSDSPITDESADEKQDPTKTIGILIKKFSGTDTENQVTVTSKLTAKVSPSVSAKERPKRKPLTDIEKARMYAASVLLDTEEKAPPKEVSRSGFSWLKR